MRPVSGSAFKLRQRTQRKMHFTVTSGDVPSWGCTDRVAQSSSSNGGTSPLTSMCMFGRSLRRKSSLRCSLGSLVLVSSSEAVEVTSSGAASAKRIRCGCIPSRRANERARSCLGKYAAPGISLLPEPPMKRSRTWDPIWWEKKDDASSPMSIPIADVPKILTLKLGRSMSDSGEGVSGTVSDKGGDADTCFTVNRDQELSISSRNRARPNTFLIVKCLTVPCGSSPSAGVYTNRKDLSKRRPSFVRVTEDTSTGGKDLTG